MQKKPSKAAKETVLFPLRHRQLKNGYLITSEDGRFALLDRKEFSIYKSGNNLFVQKLLEKKRMSFSQKAMREAKKKLRDKYMFLANGTSLHIIVVTLRCNEKCLYCHASSKCLGEKKYDMSEKTAKKTVDLIFQSPSKFITIEFQGGEPLLNFAAVKYIVNYANRLNKYAKKDLRFTLVTNLSLMDQKKLRFLLKNDVGVCTSLDGQKPLHDRNRPMPALKGQGSEDSSSHDCAVRGIKAIQQEYKKRGKGEQINALLTVTRESLQYPKEIIDEYLRLGLHSIHLRFLNRLGYAKSCSARLDYSAEEYIEFWKKAMGYIIELNKKGIYFEERLTKIILKKIHGAEPNYLDLRSPCGAVIGQLTYNYDGRVYSCDEGRMLGEDIFQVGSVKDGYKKIITAGSPIISSSINDSQYCDMCAYKPYCGVCPVCNYAEQGSIIANIPNTRHCKIYMAAFDYVFEKLLFDKAAARVFARWLGSK
jgi:uncharacterized protein